MKNDIGDFVKRTQAQLTARSKKSLPQASRNLPETRGTPAAGFSSHSTTPAAQNSGGTTLEDAIVMHTLLCPPGSGSHHTSPPAEDNWRGNGGSFGGGGASDDFSSSTLDSFGSLDDISSAVRSSTRRRPIARVLSL